MHGGYCALTLRLDQQQEHLMEKVTNVRGLEVYKLCRKLAKEIFQLTKNFPREEMYSLTDQIRRSSRSVGGQIAEAWGKRRYEKHFISKLTDADGEQLETQHWLDTARECCYITELTAEDLINQYLSVGSMIDSMIKKAKWFKP